MDAAQALQYKSILLEMRRRLMREIGDIEEAIVEDTISPGEISHAPTHMGNIANSNPDVNIALAANEETILEEVEAALERIENGSFGQCEDCGHDVSGQRLDAIPYTSVCAPCARQRERAKPDR